MTKLSCLMALFVIVCSEWCGAQGTVAQDPAKADPAGLVRAEEAIRSWARDRGAPGLKLKGTKPAGRIGPSLYYFETDDRQTFDVDAATGEILRWHDDSYKYEDGSTPGAKKKTDREIAEIAQAFLEQHCPGYKADDLQPIIPGLLYKRRLHNGVMDSGLSVVLSIDSYKGTVFGYMAYRRQQPVYVSTIPKITAKEAESIAQDIFRGLPTVRKFNPIGSAFVRESRGPYLDDDSIGLQTLIWCVTIITSVKPNYTRADYEKELKTDALLTGKERIVCVDALTGEVIFVDGPELGGVIPGLLRKSRNLSAQALKKLTSHVSLYERLCLMQARDYVETDFPPLVINGTPYVYGRVVAVLLGRRVLSENDRSISIGGKESIEFRANSAQAKVGKTSVDLGSKCVGLFGRTYVPLKGIEKVFGVTAEWEKSAELLEFPKAEQ